MSNRQLLRRGWPVVLVHVLLVAVIVAGFAIWGDGRNPGAAARYVTLPDPDPRSPVLDTAVAIVEPPGTIVLDTTDKQLGKSPSAVLQPTDAGVLIHHGAAYVKAMVTRDAGLTQGLWQVAIADGHDPHAALLAIDDLYARVGYQLDPGWPAGVQVRVVPRVADPNAGQLTVFRAHYLHGPLLIRIEVYGPDQEETARVFDELAERQLGRWPPT